MRVGWIATFLLLLLCPLHSLSEFASASLREEWVHVSDSSADAPLNDETDLGEECEDLSSECVLLSQSRIFGVWHTVRKNLSSYPLDPSEPCLDALSEPPESA